MGSDGTRPGTSDDWKKRIGGDTWKNVIMLECEAVRRVRNKNPSPVKTPASSGGLPDVLKRTAWAYEVVDGDGDPCARSFLVWQTGRLFVVGPTEKAVKRLAELNHPYINVVLLNWDPRHYCGIKQLLALYGNHITIWTSYWLWEEILPSLDADLPRDCTPARQYEVFAPWRENKVPEKPGAALFERNSVWLPTTGVSLAMSYSVAPEPFLTVQFRCNNLGITIDPAIDALGEIDLALAELREQLGL
jgi:hypothetical protein